MVGGNPFRALTQADLGLSNQNLVNFNGTVKTFGTVTTIRINLIQGEIDPKVIFQIIANAKVLAASRGSSTVEIEGVIANQTLLNIMVRRYNALQVGSYHVITLQVP